jgi:hypothetical protein
MAEPSNETILALIQQGMKHQDAKLEQILAQTTKTNGRVTKVEEEIEAVQKWMIKDDTIKRIIYTIIVAVFAVAGGIVGMYVEWKSNTVGHEPKTEINK